MTTYIIEYFNDTELPEYLKNTKLIKFEGVKNNGKSEGPCIVGYNDNYNYYYEKIYFINCIKNSHYKRYDYKNNLCEEGNYKDDKKNGPYKSYYSNGNIYEFVNKSKRILRQKFDLLSNKLYT